MTEVCSRCVLDTDDPNISFDGKGICNYCKQFEEHPEGWGITSNALQVWAYKIYRMKVEARGEHHCILGISGGVDSSYLCHVAEVAGLNPLLVHVDGGFDDPLAVRNMEKLIEHTGFEHITYTLDPDEFRSLLLAYLRSSVLDTDMPSDYGIEVYQLRTALNRKIRYILTGWNYHNEAFMPTAWNYPNKLDHTNLRNIHNKFGEGIDIHKLWTWGAFQQLYYKNLFKIEKVAALNYINYSKKKAVKWLKKNWGWKEYRDKHGENIFTRLYQRHILYRKFGIDKRKAHYSNLIRSGGMTRDEALEELKNDPYDREQFKEDLAFTLSKLRLSMIEWNEIMNTPRRPHEIFGSDERWYRLARLYLRVKKKLARLKRKLHKAPKFNTSMELMKHWIETDSYEPIMQRKIKQLSGDIMVDVGANAGIYSIMMKNKFRVIYAYEPDKAAYSRLQYYRQRFKATNVQPHNFAISNTNGTQLFAKLDYKNKGIDPITSIQLGSTKHFQEYKVGEVELGCYTLASLFKPSDLIDLVKVDVEGNGLKVLEGAIPIIHHIKSWLFELHPCCAIDVVYFLQDEGYNVEWLSPDFIYGVRR